MAKPRKLSKRENDKRKAEMKEARRQRKVARRAEKEARGEVAPRPKRSLLSSIDPEKMNKSRGPPGLQKPIPPPALFDLMHNFLKDYNYVKAAHGLRTDNQKRPGHNMVLWKHKGNDYPALIDIFTQWEKEHPRKVPQGMEKNFELADVDDESSSDESSSDESSSDDDAMSVDGGAIAAPELATVAKSLKRKASTSSSGSSASSSNESSASVSDDESASDEEAKDVPIAKKMKTTATETTLLKVPDVETSSSSESSSSEEGGDEDSSSSSSSASGAGAGVSVPDQTTVAAAVPLPSSSSESSSDSSSESDSSSSTSESSSEDEGKAGKAVQKIAETHPPARTGSDSSATLPITDVTESTLSKSAVAAASSSSSSSSSSESSDAEVMPAPAKKQKQKQEKKQELLVYTEPASKTKRKRDPSAVGEEKTVPATAQNFKKLKKAHIPFSRIPVDIKVDEKFASNKYISYDYADKAHQDLIVTKGKGFTKAKNKGKRGSYKGGAIDTVGVRAVKFDD